MPAGQTGIYKKIKENNNKGLIKSIISINILNFVFNHIKTRYFSVFVIFFYYL